jgi:hypothetical protein
VSVCVDRRLYSARGPIGCGVRLTFAGVAARAHARSELERRGILGTLTLDKVSVNRDGHASFTAPSLPSPFDDCLGDLNIASEDHPARRPLTGRRCPDGYGITIRVARSRDANDRTDTPLDRLSKREWQPFEHRAALQKLAGDLMSSRPDSLSWFAAADTRVPDRLHCTPLWVGRPCVSNAVATSWHPPPSPSPLDWAVLFRGTGEKRDRAGALPAFVGEPRERREDRYVRRAGWRSHTARD